MKGFSLLEVLIGLFLFSVGSLCFLQYQSKIKGHLRRLYYKQVALEQGLSMRERFYANQGSLYRQREIIEWNRENAQCLPQGEGKILCRGINCQILICWMNEKTECIQMRLKSTMVP